MLDLIYSFFRNAPGDCGPIVNERALQLELACYLRSLGIKVEFEKRMSASRLPGSTAKPKTNLDLQITKNGEVYGIELKVPLNGQHPETMYSYCMDIEFIEALTRERLVNTGYCVMLTNDMAFWRDSGRGSEIHDMFRVEGKELVGTVQKPTGAKNSCVVLEHAYRLASAWRTVEDDRLMRSARHLTIQIGKR